MQFAVPASLAQIDNDTAYYCAYNFPAVLLTLGKDAWHGRLKPLHTVLVGDMRWKVRRCLAYSLHECANILGSELTEKDLMPVLFHLLQDIADVAEGVLTNLPAILRVLTQD